MAGSVQIGSPAYLTPAPQSQVQVGSPAYLTSTASTGKVQCGGPAYLTSVAQEPFRPVQLPPGSWRQTTGPATAPPNIIVPATKSGVTLVWTTATCSYSIKAYPHTLFMRNSAGALIPVNNRPSPATPIPAPRGFGYSSFGTSPFGS